MMKFKIHIYAVWLVLFFGADVFGKEDTKKKSKKPTVENRIVDGFSVPTSTFPSVAKITMLLPDGTPYATCTGTLISKRHILTAAHCVTDNSGVQDIGHADNEVILGGTKYRSTRVHIHPTWKGNTPVDGEFDAAILELEKDVIGIEVRQIYRKEPKKNDVLTLVGFGKVGTGGYFFPDPNTLPAPQIGSVNYGGTTLDEIPSDTYLTWTFNKGEAGADQGDSGGPAYIEVEGEKFVAGITSVVVGPGGGTVFGNKFHYARVDKIADWIDSIAPPPPPPSPTPPDGPAPEITGNLTAVGAKDAPFTYNITAFGDPAPSFSVAGLPPGVGFSGTAIGGWPLESGKFNVTLTAVNKNGFDREFLELTVLDQSSPKILSGLTLSSENPTPGESVDFFAVVEDPMGGPTKYKWDFGDGTTSTENNPVHAFPTAGTYTVTFFAIGASGATTTETLTVKVLGSINGPKVSIKVNHAKKGKDSITAKFGITLPEKFQFSSAKFTFSIGDVSGKNPYTTNGKPFPGPVKIRVKPERRQNPASAFSANVKIQMKGSFAEALAESGLDNTDTSGKQISLPIRFTAEREFVRAEFGGSITLSYKSKSGRSGRAKSQ